MNCLWPETSEPEPYKPFPFFSLFYNFSTTYVTPDDLEFTVAENDLEFLIVLLLPP